MTTPQLVPKVHPATREVESDDPLELVASPAPGDADVMLECIVQEFAGLGYDADELTGLFSNPAYPVPNQLLHYYGPAEIRRRIETLLARAGVFRTHEVIADDPEPDDNEAELIELTVRRRE
jgi:hypothetical protein